MPVTNNLRLSVTPRETNKNFIDWRLQQDGPDDSNMIKLDKGWGDMKTMVDGAMMAAGHANAAATKAAMTDHDKVYVYTGDGTGEDAGMVNGHWYYWDGTAWTSGGVYQATAIETDATLKVEGEAADAKAAGEMIIVNGTSSDGTRVNITTTNEDVVLATMDDVDELGSAIDDLKEVTVEEIHSANLWNPETATNNFLVGSDGNPSPNNSCIISDFIPIPDGMTYVRACCSDTNSLTNFRFLFGRIGFYKSDKTFISRENNANNAISIPENSAFIRIDFINTYYYFYVDFSTETTAPTYVAYSVELVNIALAKAEEVEDELESYNPHISQSNLTFAELITKNLLNVYSEDSCKQGYWYYSTTIGTVMSPVSNQYTGQYFALKAWVKGIEKVTIGVDTSIASNPNVYWVGAVDADMKLLSYSIINESAPATYTLPDNAEYFLASVPIQTDQSTVLSALMVVSGDTIGSYEPYVKPYYLLRDCKAEPISQAAPTLKVPIKYDLVVGDTFQLFYKGIVDAVNPDSFEIVAKCDSGSNYTRMFEYTPASAGTKTLTLELYDANHTLLDSKAVSLVAKSVPSSPAANKNVLCVGDSLTTDGTWCKEMKRRLVESGGDPTGDNLSNITFIGTKTKTGINYEGYGGWTFNSYNTANVSTNSKIITCTHDKTEAEDQHSIYRDGANELWKLETIEAGSIRIICTSGTGSSFPSTGTLTWVSGGVNHSNIVYTASTNAPGNPFWNDSENKVDFASYAQGLGASSIDYVFVLLGWNGAASTTEELTKQEAQTFIDNVHTSYPNAKIVLMGLEIPARDGLGANYGASGFYSNYYGLIQYVHNLDEWYADLASDNSNVYSINVSGQFDTEYNMMTNADTGTTIYANTRSDIEITRQINGIHPAVSGQMQIADAAYREMIFLLS